MIARASHWPGPAWEFVYRRNDTVNDLLRLASGVIGFEGKYVVIVWISSITQYQDALTLADWAADRCGGSRISAPRRAAISFHVLRSCSSARIVMSLISMSCCRWPSLAS